MAANELHELAESELEAFEDDTIHSEFGADDIEAVLSGWGWQEADIEGVIKLILIEGFDRDEDGKVGETTSSHGIRGIMERAAGDPRNAQRYAEWALRKRKEALLWQAQVDAVAEARVANIRAHQADIQKKTKHSVEYLDYLLLQYRHEAFPGQEGTIKLEGGELRRDKQRDRLEWDLDGAVTWALQQEAAWELVDAKKEPIKARLQEHNGRWFGGGGVQVDFLAKVPPDELYKESVKQ